MAGNVNPQFVKAGNISGALVTAANTSSAGGGTIGTDIFLVFTADATNGSLVELVRWMAVASAASTAMTATTLRLFISSKTSGATSSADTWLWDEKTGPAITADSPTVGVYPIDVAFNIRLPPSYTILATNHAAPAANSNWRAFVPGGNY